MKHYISIILLLLLISTGAMAQLNAIDIGTKSSSFTYTDTKNTATTGNNYTARSPNDVIYKFTLSVPMEVEMNHCSSAIDTYLTLLNSSQSVIYYNDDWSGEGRCANAYHSYLKVQLAAGTYYVVSEGYRDTEGITTTITGTVASTGGLVDMGTKSSSFTYTDTKNTATTGNNYTGRAPNDVLYKFTLTVPMEVVMNHCGSALSDTYLTLLNASQTVITLNDDYNGAGACSNTYHSYLKIQLAAGTYYVVSEGYSNVGDITTTITGTVASTGGLVDMGSKSASFTYTDTKNTSTTGNNYTGRAPNDVLYKFTLTVPMEVEMNHCGSALSDTYLTLLNASQAVIDYNDDYYGAGCCSNTRNSYLKVQLAAGTYFVVSEGYNSVGDITTTITGTTAAPPLPAAPAFTKLPPIAASPSPGRNYIKKRTYTDRKSTRLNSSH